MAMEANVEAEPEAEKEAEDSQEQNAKGLMLAAEAEPERAVAEADAVVESIMSIAALRSAQEAEEAKEEAEPMPPLEEVARRVEAAEAKHILQREAIESKQEAEADVLFADQDEYKQQEEERTMAKLFELPPMTPGQQAINRNIRDAFSLVDEGDQQLRVKEEHGLIIFGKSKSGKSTLANMLAGRELTAAENAKGWQILLTDPEMHSEGAAAASGR